MCPKQWLRVEVKSSIFCPNERIGLSRIHKPLQVGSTWPSLCGRRGGDKTSHVRDGLQSLDVLSLAIVTRPRPVRTKETEDRVGSKCNCPSSDGTLPQRWKFQFYWPNTPLKPQKPLLGDFGGKEIGNRKWCIDLIDLISFENVGFNGHRNPNGSSGKVKGRPERWFCWMSPEFLLLCCEGGGWGGAGLAQCLLTPPNGINMGGKNGKIDLIL